MSPLARAVAGQLRGHSREVRLAVLRSLPVDTYDALAVEAVAHLQRARVVVPPSNPTARALLAGVGLDEMLYGAVGGAT